MRSWLLTLVFLLRWRELSTKRPRIFFTEISLDFFLVFQPALHMLLRGVDRRDYAGVSRVLLNYGADVLQRNNSGQTPLDRCSDTEVEQLVREIAASKGYQ